MSKFVIMLIALVFYVHFSSEEEDETSQMISVIAFAVFVAMLCTLTFST